jgi:methanogen homoaconitase small subunit
MARVWKFGDDIDTDQMVPGRYAPVLTGDDNTGKYCFIERRPEFAKQAQPGDIIVAGKNFGCGSSREYATVAVKQSGIAAIVAVSVARIFFRNAVNLGIPVFEDPAAVQMLADGESVEFNLETGAIKRGDATLRLAPPAPFVQAIVREGGIVPYFLKYKQFPTGETES